MPEYKDCRNPILPPTLHIPDPEAHVMPDGRLYLYGSWDQEADTFCSRQYRVFSTPNMRDWTDHGISFQSRDVPWLGDEAAPRYPSVDWDFADPPPFLQGIIARMPKRDTSDGDSPGEVDGFVPKGDYLYAPDAIYRDGRWYLYFCCSDQSEGVAVADRPKGPFSQAARLPVGGIDPAVFVDDDGQAYFYWGQFRASGAKLQPNMIELMPNSIVPRLVTEEAHGFHEGSSLRKRQGIYYFVYPCVYRQGKPTALAYATAAHPLGPFTYRGIIIDNARCDPESWNIHGCIEEIGGQWYVFYHRSTGRSQYMRRLCAEPIYFDEDGMIAEVKMTSQGAGRPFGLGEALEGWRACELEGSVYIANTALLGMQHGDIMFFRYVDFPQSPSGIQINATGSGILNLFVDDDMPIATLRIAGGMAQIDGLCCPAGLHQLRIHCEASDGLQLNSITFI